MSPVAPSISSPLTDGRSPTITMIARRGLPGMGTGPGGLLLGRPGLARLDPDLSSASQGRLNYSAATHAGGAAVRRARKASTSNR